MHAARVWACTNNLVWPHEQDPALRNISANSTAAGASCETVRRRSKCGRNASVDRHLTCQSLCPELLAAAAGAGCGLSWHAYCIPHQQLTVTKKNTTVPKN